MNFTAKTLPYQQTGYFSKLITDYLNRNEFLQHHYTHPVSYAGLEAAMQDRENFPTDRVLLVKILEAQYVSLTSSPAVRANLESLSLKTTFTITTAHQPAIFTGNLFFIYKILHVIKLADSLNKRFPAKHFVPVFYMGSEDADLDELGHIYLGKEKISWDTQQTGSVGRMSPAGLDRIIARIEGEFSGFSHGAALVQLLKDCYLDADNIQQATFKLLHHLFGSYGLVILIPDNRQLKSTMRGIFKDDLTNHAPFEIIRKQVQDISQRYAVQANPREINLFYLKEDLRERIESANGQYTVHNTNIRFSADEMEKELSNYPERFSPNVILRGLFQATILPDIAFVGGGGEIAYWLEFKPLFQHYRVPLPVLILRNSFLLVKKNWLSRIEKIGLPTESLFISEEQMMATFVMKNSSRQIKLDKEIQALQSLYESVKKISGATDKTLEQHVEKLKTQAIEKLEELEKKILRAEKKNYQEVRNRVHEIREVLFPANNLQERIENFIPWYAEFGAEFIDLLFSQSLTLEQDFTVLEESH